MQAGSTSKMIANLGSRSNSRSYNITSDWNTKLFFQSKLLFAFVLFIILSTVLTTSSAGSYYSTSDQQLTSEMLDELGNGQLNYPLWNGKRNNCLRRGSRCDYRPNGCCDSSVCRCNLWGSNCRCQRQGLLQRLGKRAM
ncbi:uncharacterized protein LOC141854369 [Brevipalpus obovatus]|uniref:uncharacterized protein LOC141854369 n=1 Tax=Brevipalpus obovatus TaxID=246614 RepID=UPI003D9F98FA